MTWEMGRAALPAKLQVLESQHLPPPPIFYLTQASLLGLEPGHSLPILQPQRDLPSPAGRETRFLRGSWPHPFLGAGLVEGD